MLTVAETRVRHASSAIVWIDGASRPDASNPSRVPHRLALELTAPPRDLVAVAKVGKTVLWRRVPAGMNASVSGRATKADLERPIEADYELRGVVLDPTGQFNPRRFAVTVGSASRRSVILHRSMRGASSGLGAALEGNVRFSQEVPASWALLELRVTVIGGGATAPLLFRAQADRFGDFRMPLPWLPSRLAEINTSTHPPALQVRASPSQSGVQVPALELLEATTIMSDADTSFGANFAPALVPGRTVRISSHGSNSLVIAN